MSDKKHPFDLSGFEPKLGADTPHSLHLLRHAFMPPMDSYVDAYGTAIVCPLPQWQGKIGVPRFVPHTSNPSCQPFSGPVRTLREEDEHGILPRHVPHATVLWLKPEALTHRHDLERGYSKLEAKAEQLAQTIEMLLDIPLEARLFYPFKGFQQAIGEQSQAALILATTPPCAARLDDLKQFLKEKNSDLRSREAERQVVASKRPNQERSWAERFGAPAIDADTLAMESLMRHTPHRIGVNTLDEASCIAPLPTSMRLGLANNEAIKVNGIDNHTGMFAPRGLTIWLGPQFRKAGVAICDPMREECHAMVRALENRHATVLHHRLAPLEDCLLHTGEAPTALLLFASPGDQRLLLNEVRRDLARFTSQHHDGQGR